MRLSASKVDCFFGCPRQFKYRYLRPPFKEPDNRYFVIGNIAHYALELFYKGYGHQLPFAKEQKKRLTEHLRQAIKKYKAKDHIRNGLITKQDIIAIKEMLKDYIAIIPNIPGEAKHTEQYFNIKIEGIEVSGKADRIDEVEGKKVVIDYKTSSKPKFDPKSVQLPTYALWLQNVYGIPLEQIEGQYYYLRHLRKKSGIKSFPITEDTVEAAKEKYLEVAAAIEDEDTLYTRNTKHFCFICAYKTHCMQDSNDYLD